MLTPKNKLRVVPRKRGQYHLGRTMKSSKTSSSSDQDDRLFQKYVEEIITYRDKKSGDILLPLDSSTRKLRRWISLQKKRYSEESLPYSHVTTLESLGLKFKKISSDKKINIHLKRKEKPQQKPFPVRLKELKALNKRQGNLKSNPSLYQWTLEQKSRYEEGSLTSAEERQLKSSGLTLGGAKKKRNTKEISCTAKKPKTKEISGSAKKQKTKEICCTEKKQKAKEISVTVKKPKTEEIGGGAKKQKAKEIGGATKKQKTKEVSGTARKQNTKEIGGTTRKQKAKEMPKPSQDSFSAMDNFDTVFKKLKTFKDKHGHCNVTKSNDAVLFRWISLQKRRDGKNDLSRHELVQLQSIGLLDRKSKPIETNESFSSKVPAKRRMQNLHRNQKTFEARVAELATFKDEHGQFNVNWKKDKIYRWFMKMKRSWRKGDLSSDEMRQLKAIGFGISKQRPIDTNDNRLQKETEDDIEEDDEEDDDDERHLETNRNRLRKEAEDDMEEDKTEGKNDVEGGEENLSQDFRDSLENLIHVRDLGGKSSFPESFKRQVFAWAQKQRERYVEGNLTKAEERKLHEAGFLFQPQAIKSDNKREIDERTDVDENDDDKGLNARKAKFFPNLQKLVQFKDTHGKLEINEKTHNSLYKWISEQKKKHKLGHLLSFEEKELRSIGLIKGKKCIIFPLNVKKLKDFVHKNGHCNLNCNDNKKLHRWVTKQKYKRNAGTMLREDEEILDELGVFDEDKMDGNNEDADVDKGDEVKPNKVSDLKGGVFDADGINGNNENADMKEIHDIKADKVSEYIGLDSINRHSFEDKTGNERDRVCNERANGQSSAIVMKDIHEIEVNKVSESRGHNSMIQQSFEGEKIHERPLVCHESANGQASVIASLSHERSSVTYAEDGSNSSNLLTRLSHLYEMTGHTPNSQDGLLKRLEFLEDVFFGNRSQVKGLFINRIQLLEKELLSPPEELCLEYGKKVDVPMGAGCSHDP